MVPVANATISTQLQMVLTNFRNVTRRGYHVNNVCVNINVSLGTAFCTPDAVCIKCQGFSANFGSFLKVCLVANLMSLRETARHTLTRILALSQYPKCFVEFQGRAVCLRDIRNGNEDAGASRCRAVRADINNAPSI